MAVAGFLEGLLGGALTGADFRRRRDLDGMAVDDRKRRMAQEEEDRALLREQHRRAGIVQDINLREQHGLAFDVPRMSVDELRTGVGDALKTFDQMEVPGTRETFLAEPPPDGMFRVGPSASLQAGERAARLRSAVGAELGMDPDRVEGLHEFGILDDLIGQRVEGGDAPFKVNVDGISTSAATPEEAIAARDRFAVPEPEPGIDQNKVFDQTNALADDFAREAQVAVDVAAAVTRAQSAGDNAVGDQTRIIALNKLLDPGSIVREGEFNRVGRAGGLEAQAQFFFSQMKDGRLPPELRASLDAEIASQARAASQALAPTIARFNERATSFGLNPAQVTFDPFSGLVGGGAPPPDDIDAVIDEMIANGASDEDIAAELRRRGG